jgi:hypothetical protein
MQVFRVASFVLRELWNPKIKLGFGKASVLAAGVSVPETPMDEDHLPALREDHVGPTRELRSMHAVAVAQRVQQAPNSHFRLGIP